MSALERGVIYRKVERAMWSDRRFRELSAPPPNAQTLWLYLLTGQRTTIFPGFVTATLEVLASDLRWSLDDTRACWKEIEDAGMATADWRAGVILLTKGLFDSANRLRDSVKPGSPNTFRGWLNKWTEMPECELSDRYLRMLGTFAHALGDPYLDEYLDCYPNASIDAYPKASSTSTPRRRRPARDPVPDPDPVPSSLSSSGSDLGSGDPHTVPSQQVSLPLVPGLAPALPDEVEDGTDVEGLSQPGAVSSGTRGGLRPQLVVLTGETSEEASEAPMFGDIANVRRRNELFQATEQAILAARTMLAAELGCANRYVHPERTAQERFLARTAKSRDPAGDIAHVLAVAVEEARGTESLEYLGWSIFEEKTWGRKLGADPVRIREKYAQIKQRGGCSSPGDIAREEQRRIDAEALVQAAQPIGAN